MIFSRGKSMWEPCTWEPPINPPDDPLETPIEILTDHFIEQETRRVSEVDVEEAMGDLNILFNRDIGETTCTPGELEAVTQAVNDALEENLSDIEAA